MRNAWLLLLYAWDLAVYADRFDSEMDDATSLLGLLARVLHDATQPLLRRQLGRSFRQHTQEIEGVRGRIDLVATARLVARQTSRTRCTYNQLTVDTPRNRLLKATLARLARDPRLTHPSRPQKEKKIRQDLRQLVREMKDVTLAPVDFSVLSSLQLGRNDREYRLPLKICELVHRLQMPSEDSGDHAWMALQRDEIKFHDLFERFSRNYLRVHFPGWDVASKRLTWPVEEDASLLMPTMQTDISLSDRATGYRIVVDTKFYQHTLSTHHRGTGRFHSQHLYQLYTYLRTQEERSDHHRRSTGVLLYPRVDQMLDERSVVQGHMMRVMTVNLAAAWSDIEAQMRNVVNGSIGHLPGRDYMDGDGQLSDTP